MDVQRKRHCWKCKITIETIPLDSVFYLHCNSCYKNQVERTRLDWHIGRKDVLLPCSICLDSYQFQKRSLPHECSKRGAYSCHTCGYQFESEESLNVHCRIVHSRHQGTKQMVIKEPRPKNKSCEFCNKQFSDLWKLRVHRMSHTGVKPFLCERCSKGFSKSSDLKRHLRTHTGEKPYVCQVEGCTRAFGDSSQFKLHMQKHAGDRRYGCTDCDKRFYRMVELSRHKLVHSGERPFPCTICESRFAQTSSLRTHMQTHTGERPANCSICEKRFLNQSDLRAHFRIHTGEKPFGCEFCDKWFALSSNLYRHYQSRRHARKKASVENGSEIQ